MSAQHAPHDDADRDPHDIIPDAFYRAWPGDSIAAKLRAAEQAPTSTDPERLPRCDGKWCGSTRLVPKSDKYESAQRKDGAYTCANCGKHVTDPRPPLVEEIGEQATLEGGAWR